MKAIITMLRQIGTAILALLTDRTHHQPANFTNIKALLLHLCDYDDVKCEWMMRWLAYPLRNPGAKMDRGIVVNGEQGTGKTLFFATIVARLYEDRSARVLDASQLHARLNGWAIQARLVIFDGKFSKKNSSRLKDYISAESLPIYSQYEATRHRKNRLNFAFLSTSSEFLPVIESDRRLFVLEAPPRKPRWFYEAVAHEIENGGIDAFREFLTRGLDMTGFDEHTQPPADPAQRALRQVA